MGAVESGGLVFFNISKLDLHRQIPEVLRFTAFRLE